MVYGAGQHLDQPGRVRGLPGDAREQNAEVQPREYLAGAAAGAVSFEDLLQVASPLWKTVKKVGRVRPPAKLLPGHELRVDHFQCGFRIGAKFRVSRQARLGPGA